MANYALGIDISKWQGDYDLAKAMSEGVKFVILKGAGGDVGLYTDEKFVRNYNLAKSLKLPVGAYFFSKALSVTEAKKEAKYFYNNCLKGRTFELPVYYDVESWDQLSLGQRKVTDIIKAFCDYIQSKGFVVGIYSSTYNFRDRMYDEELNKYERWIAHWATKCSYNGDYGMWQFGGETNLIRSNKIAGKVVDQNYMIKDYLKGKVDQLSSMTTKQKIKKLIEVTTAEIGYLEKKSNSQLDDKTANAGYNNWTKYARDLDNISGFYNGPKNGFPWCDVFVDWCFVKAFDAETGRKMLYQPYYSAGAGCTNSMGYFKANGAFYKTPKVGDQIFFGSGVESSHTGLVVDVSSTTVTTIEGNTSGSAGVISNGGGVFKKTYPIGYAGIVGYGRPNYSLSPTNSQNIISVNTILTVKDVQSYLNKKYESKLDEDGAFGPLTKKALVMAVQKEMGRENTGEFSLSDKKNFKLIKRGSSGNLVRLIQCMLICKGFSVGTDGADGDFGNNTLNSVKRFQTKNNLEIDGIVGPETAYKLFN